MPARDAARAVDRTPDEDGHCLKRALSNRSRLAERFSPRGGPWCRQCKRRSSRRGEGSRGPGKRGGMQARSGHPALLKTRGTDLTPILTEGQERPGPKAGTVANGFSYGRKPVCGVVSLQRGRGNAALFCAGGVSSLREKRGFLRATAYKGYFMHRASWMRKKIIFSKGNQGSRSRQKRRVSSALPRRAKG